MFPKSGTLLNLPEDYNKNFLKRDIIAGLTVFIMLVPQAMAYAMLAGLPPVMGLYASTIPLFIYALFGSSRKLGVGPVAMASILTFSGVSLYAEPNTSEYISLVLLLTLMVGIMQLILGLLNAGVIVKFISQNVISGFTSAVALTIGMSQLSNFLGIEVNSTQFYPRAVEIAQNLTNIHVPTLIIGALSIAILVGVKKLTKRLPLPLIVVILSTLTVVLFQLDQKGVSIVGDVPQGFPGLAVPPIDFSAMQVLIPTALTIAMIAMMESLSISKTLADKDSPPVNVNKELRAIGLSNIVGSFISAYAVTGSFSRSAVNHRSGAVSQVSAIVTGSGVFLTLLFFTSYFYYLPHAVLASIILVAVSGLINVESLIHAFKVKPADGWVWIITFAATLFVGIQWGLLIGIGFSLLLLLQRISRPNIAELGFDEKSGSYRDIKRFPNARHVPGMVLIRIDARIHFSNVGYFEKVVAEKIQKALKGRTDKQKLVIDMAGVNDIDTMGIESLENFLHKYKDHDEISIYFVHLKGPVRDLLQRAGWEEKFPGVISYLTLEQFLKEEKGSTSPPSASNKIIQHPPIDYMI